jgi:hypothetical protein
MTTTTTSTEISDRDTFLATMRERFKLAEEALTEIHAEARRDFQFRAGNQWEPDVLSERTADGRPCYTINRIPQFLRQVTGAQKKTRPAIEISPIGENADIETAEIEQGLVRYIERNSDAEDAYDTAFDHMATGGFGFIRLATDYVDNESFDQAIRFERENDPFAHFPDPTCKKRDYSDAGYWFVIKTFTAQQFKSKYKTSELAGLDDFSTMVDNAPDWIQRDSVRVAEYFWVECTYDTITKRDPKTKQNYQREKETRHVYRCETNGFELFEQSDIPGEYIPLVPVLGEDYLVDGKRMLVGIVRWARRPQQLYNLWQSAMAETIALAPKAPFMATPTQIEGYEDVWDTLNQKNYPYLPVNPDKNAPGWPQRQFGEPPIQAITGAIAHADNDLKTTTGLNNASLGEPGPEESGKAILLRQKQGEGATFGFQDAMGPAIKQCGRIIVGWIPHYYDAERVVAVVNPDGTSRLVPINQPFKDDAGLQKVFDLTVGKFDVAISQGPSEDSMRQEAAESMMQLVAAHPEMMGVIGDLLVRAMDWPLANEIADRLHKMLPPQLQEKSNAQIPPQAQAQLAQQAQMISQLSQALHQMAAKVEGKTAELASRERIVLIQTKASLIEALLKVQSQEAMAMFSADIAQIDRQLAMIPDPALGDQAGGAPAPGAAAPAPRPQPQPQQVETPLAA